MIKLLLSYESIEKLCVIIADGRTPFDDTYLIL